MIFLEGPNLLSALAACGGLAGGGWPDGKELSESKKKEQSFSTDRFDTDAFTQLVLVARSIFMH